MYGSSTQRRDWVAGLPGFELRNGGSPRILERFGNCGLANVCAQLCEIAREDKQRALRIARGYIWLRALVFALLAAGIAVLVSPYLEDAYHCMTVREVVGFDFGPVRRRRVVEWVCADL